MDLSLIANPEQEARGGGLRGSPPPISQKYKKRGRSRLSEIGRGAHEARVRVNLALRTV